MYCCISVAASPHSSYPSHSWQHPILPLYYTVSRHNLPLPSSLLSPSLPSITLITHPSLLPPSPPLHWEHTCISRVITVGQVHHVSVFDKRLYLPSPARGGHAACPLVNSEAITHRIFCFRGEAGRGWARRTQDHE